MTLKEKEEKQLIPKVIRAINHKTSKIYLILAVGAIDCTNERDGTSVVIYCPDNDENTLYVREEVEFFEKFSEMDVWGGADG